MDTMMQKEETKQKSTKKGNASIAVSLLVTFLIIGIIAIAGFILAAQMQLTQNIVGGIVGTNTTTAYNNTTQAAGQMLSTAYQLGGLVILGLIGGATLLALIYSLWPIISGFVGGGPGGRGM